MRLESALISGREGISSHGQAISVVGDNISNVNTDGYKTSRVEFADLLPCGASGDPASTDEAVGCGAYVTDVRQVFDQGMLESTGRTLDVGIDGGGFFIVGDSANPMYSRAGNFSVNVDGNLVNGLDQQVLGYAPGATTLSPLSLNNINLTGSVTTTASLTGNINASLPLTTVPANPQTFQELGQAASYVATMDVYDSLGQSHNVSVNYFKTGMNTWTVQAYMDGGDVGGTAGVPVKVGTDATLTFNTSGALDAANAANAKITATPAYGNGAAGGNFTIDFSKFTQFASASSLSGLAQNGQSAGNVKNFEIATDGGLYANLDSGARQLVGTIQLANFTNVDGLQRSGSLIFRSSEDTGTISVGTPGNGAFGKLMGGTLERSNVDITNEFVDLVVLQRGSQANSQTLQVGNELLRDTIALMR